MDSGRQVALSKLSRRRWRFERWFAKLAVPLLASLSIRCKTQSLVGTPILEAGFASWAPPSHPTRLRNSVPRKANMERGLLGLMQVPR